MERHYYFKSINTDKVIKLDKPVLTIGRGERCDLTVDSGLLSREHARLLVSARKLVLEDLGSTNGTFVNGNRIAEPTVLTHGDILTIGPEKYYVMAPEKAQLPGAYSHELNEQLDRFEPNDNTSNRTMIRSPFPSFNNWTDEVEPVDPRHQQPSDQEALVLKALSKRQLNRSRVPAVLVVCSGYRKGTLVELKLPMGATREWAIGRSQLADVVLDDPTVSTIHAAIRCEDGQWFLCDQESTNGVKLNGESILEAACASGDIIAIGNVEFVFRVL